jgi:hypothetical protein
MERLTAAAREAIAAGDFERFAARAMEGMPPWEAVRS